MPRNGSPVWSACLRAVVDKHKTSLISMDDSGLEAIFLDLGGVACLKTGETAARARARATLASALDRKGIKRVPTAQDKAAVCMICGFVAEHLQLHTVETAHWLGLRRRPPAPRRVYRNDAAAGGGENER